MTSSFNCALISLSDHIVSDRRGIVTPEYRAEHEQVGDDNIIINNKTYGTAKIVQPQVIANYNVIINLTQFSRYRSAMYDTYIITIYIVHFTFFFSFLFN